MFDSLQNLRIQDGVDVLIIAFVIYKAIDLIRGTRAAQMLVGLFVVAVLYVSAQAFQLYTLNWVLDRFLGSFLLLIVVIFQDDIRRALTRVGAQPFFGTEAHLQDQDLEEVVLAAASLASRGVGALIVLQREVGLNQYMEVGTRLDANVNRELLASIFTPNSPIHDGAVIVDSGRIVAAGCFLTLTKNPNVSKTLGTRHRAAIGLTEETDAIVVVVSEEDHRISLVREGRITRGLDAATLRTTLRQLMAQA